MNQQQRVYAKKRLSDIRDKKFAEIKKNNTVEEKRLTDKQRVAALRAGRFKIKPLEGVRRAMWINDVIDFDAESEGSINRDVIQKQQEAVDKKYFKILDQLMLGDGELALEMIKDFENV